MSGMKEIRSHIKSVESTLKITTAMYLIASSNLRRARKHLQDVLPYFNKLSFTISDILFHSPDVTHPFFDQHRDVPANERRIGYLVIAGDKGLAGAYNHNVVKLAEQRRQGEEQCFFFTAGQMGQNYFENHDIPVEMDFPHVSQNPTMGHARELTAPLIERFLAHDLDEVWVIYTHMINPLHLEPTLLKLLPLDRDAFPYTPREADPYPRTISYYPSDSVVLDHLVPDYFAGMLFGTLVESFCSEQCSRMSAMDSSRKNANKMLADLPQTYNHARQSALTPEITELVGGSRAPSESPSLL